MAAGSRVGHRHLSGTRPLSGTPGTYPGAPRRLSILGHLQGLRDLVRVQRAVLPMQILGQELLPRPAACGVLWWWQETAGPHGAGSRDPDRYQPMVPVAGAQVSAEQVGPAGHLWTAQVGHAAGGPAQGQLDEPGRHLVGSIGWTRKPAGTGSLASFRSPART